MKFYETKGRKETRSTIYLALSMQKLNFETLIFLFSPNKKVSETILLQRPKVLKNSLHPTKLDSATNSKNYYLLCMFLISYNFISQPKPGGR